MKFFFVFNCGINFFLLTLFIFQFSFATNLDLKSDKNGSYIDMHSVLGTSAKMECDLKEKSVLPEDITSVIWTRYNNDTPIFTFTFRGGQLVEQGGDRVSMVKNIERRVTDRSYLRVDEDNINHQNLHFLHVIDNVRLEDEGIYKCIATFRKGSTATTKTTVVNLTVIVDIREIVIFDWTGLELRGHRTELLPEGANANITCIAKGGKPLARVTWWKGGVLVDDTDDISEDAQLTTNTLWISKVSRKDLFVTYSCEAANSKSNPPITAQVTIDLYLRPLEIQLDGGKVNGLTAGVRHEMSCRMRGCRPAGNITWWKDGILMKNADVKETVGENENLTVSTLNFIPQVSDQGVTLSCRGENPKIVGSELRDSVMLHILYPPQVVLSMGSNLNASNIREGVDVYFECHIMANPWVHRVSWSHDGQPITNNVSAGIIVSNQTLVLQGVSRKRSGHYTCSASNVHGSSESNSLRLNIKYEPTCITARAIYGAARMEEVRVDCYVDANPPASIFRWTFNHTPAGDTRHISSFDVSIGGGHSVALFTPTTERDYGSLLCWSDNELGPQRAPCMFHIVPAGRPEAPSFCTATNRTHNTIHIKCKQGFDGGLNQKFVMVVTYGSNDEPIANVTSSGVPEFHLTGLRSEIFYKISVYATNDRGTSRHSRTLYVRTLAPPQEFKKFTVSTTATEPKKEEERPPWLYMLLGVISSLVVTSFFLCIVFKCCYKNTAKYMSSKRPSKDDTEATNLSTAKLSPHHDSTDLEIRSNIEDEENNPDLIPHDIVFYQQVAAHRSTMSPPQLVQCKGAIPLAIPGETYQLTNLAQPIFCQRHFETALPISHIHGAQWMTDVTVTAIPHEVVQTTTAAVVPPPAKSDVQTQTSLVRRKESTV